MGVFSKAFGKLAAAMEDFSSLEVTTYKGEVKITGNAAVPKDFDTILAKAKSQSSFKILASTKSRLDGDMTTFYDTDITADEKIAHNELIETAKSNRTAVIDLFKAAIDKDLSSS